jgi:hypothetical protein
VGDATGQAAAATLDGPVGGGVVAEPAASLDLILVPLRSPLAVAGFKEDESNHEGPYSWVRFRRQEQAQNQNWTRLVTLSHAPGERAFLADVYLVSRATHTRTPVARELRRYGGDAAEAEVAARELIEVVRGWFGA